MCENYVVISQYGFSLEILPVISMLFKELNVPDFYYGDNRQGLCCFVAKVVDCDKLVENLERLLNLVEFDFSNDFDSKKMNLD